MTFLGDQGRDALIVKRIITLQHLPLVGAPSSIGGVYLGPFYYYFIAPFLPLFHYNPAGLAYGVAVFSLIGLFLTYLVTKKINTLTAIIFLIFLSFSFSLVDLSRFSWNPNLLPIFAFGSLYFFWELLRKPSKFKGFIFGMLFALSTQLHHLVLFLGIVFIYFFVEIFFVTQNKKKFLESFITAIITFVFFISPLILFDLKHNFLNSRNFMHLFSSDAFPHSSSYLVRLGDTLQAFIFHSLQISINQIFLLITLLPFAYIFFLIPKNEKSLFTRVHYLSVLSFLILFAFIQSPRYEHYFGSIYFSFYYLLSLVIVYLIHKFRLIGYVVGVITISAFLLLNTTRYDFLHKDANNQLTFAKEVAHDIAPHISSGTMQMVPIPQGETDGHIRYFLELMGYPALSENSIEQANQLFVLCFKMPCIADGNPQWQIATFSHKKVDTIFKTHDITIYKIIHGT